MPERVVLNADGVEVVGTLHAPPGARAAVALSGPFTGVKDQVTGQYAERIAEAGYAALALDHRGFGESGGRRGHEDTQGKLADLRAAVTFLSTRHDRVGLVGVCLGGGYVMRAAATDPASPRSRASRGRTTARPGSPRAWATRTTGAPWRRSSRATTTSSPPWPPTAGQRPWRATSPTATTAPSARRHRTGATRSPAAPSTP
ncbi:alpha/beta hydrolase [Actinokineospora soli]|uniref:Alpha/beta hydrolase n=1 Tax=Actinokineospora soli TaxID=1048753 RepID=A0ABW2TVH5_9PSEU